MVMNKPTLLLDMDGTIRDTSGIIHLVTGKIRDYDGFYRSCGEAPPIARTVAVIQQRYLQAGWHVIITTGQPEDYRTDNERWLAKNLGDVTWVSMRNKGDRRKADVVKREMLHRIRAYGYDVREAWDDDPAVVQMYASERLDVHWVYNPTR